MEKRAFDFLQLQDWPPKPRKEGLFIASDRGIPLGMLEDYLEGYGDIIDYAKLSDHTGLISRVPKSWLERKLKLYRKLNIGTYIGGITFELASLQGKVEEYFKRLAEMGFTGVEVSYDTINEASAQDRATVITQARKYHLEVFTEVGRKYPDKPLETSDAVARIKADLDLGAQMVTIEASEIAAAKNASPKLAEELVKAIGMDKLAFECSPPEPWLNNAVWLIKNVGSSVNLENIPLQDCMKVYAIRHGMTRETGFPFLISNKGKV